MVPAGNKAKRLSSVNNTTKTILHHHHHHHHHHIIIIIIIIIIIYCLILGTCHNAGQFTDPTSTIYWYVKRAKLTLNMPVYNPIKPMLVFLTVSETQCIIYRPDLHNSHASS